jgi:hypothetical protein
MGYTRTRRMRGTRSISPVFAIAAVLLAGLLCIGLPIALTHGWLR